MQNVQALTNSIVQSANISHELTNPLIYLECPSKKVIPKNSNLSTDRHIVGFSFVFLYTEAISGLVYCEPW